VIDSGDATIDIDVYVRGADGAPIEVTAMVTLVAPTGQMAGQGTTMGGNIKFQGVRASQYTIQVEAPGYENAVKDFDGYNSSGARVTIEMRPESSGTTGAGLSRILLASKVQKELGKVASKETVIPDLKLSTETETATTLPPSDLLPSEMERVDATGEAQPSPASPKAQKALDKAFKLMGTYQTQEGEQSARRHLQTAYRIAPTSADVNYLFGVYWLQKYDRTRAKSYWKRAIEYYPKHYRALLSLSQALLEENKPSEALPYLERATEAEPFSWRAYALISDAYLRQGFADKAAKEAEHALELGGREAVVAQRYLAAAFAKLGEWDKAVAILKTYVRSHGDDFAAKIQLRKLQPGKTGNPEEATEASNKELLELKGIVVPAFALPANKWLPPDVDEVALPVEPGATCALEEVIRKAGEGVQEFVKNVDRFTASEFLKHEMINEWGFPGLPETRKFEYVASIEQFKPGYFNVLEYRSGIRSPSEFPGGVATNGLPALALIFHPNNAGNFEMACEGLGHSNGRRTWQVHFRQRSDKPNTMREYKIGESGPAYPVGLRGRAWIAADSYQIVRMESDLVAPVPEIRLVADHILVEYGPVRFKNRNVEMWLPQSAEVYIDWKGRRMHRRHSFSNYLLFSVDEKQRISPPKEATGNQPTN